MAHAGGFAPDATAASPSQRHWVASIDAVLASLGVSVGSLWTAEHRTEDTEIRAVLERQVREWNAGNLAGFMEIYAKSDHTCFADSRGCALANAST